LQNKILLTLKNYYIYF